MREAIILLSLFNIFFGFSKHFLIEVRDKKGKVKPSKTPSANTEHGTDYGDDDDEDYADIQDDTEGKKKPLNVFFKIPPGQAPICLLRTGE